MKRFLVLLMLLFIGTQAHATYVIETVGNMNNFWDVNGRYQEKVIDIGNKLLSANKINKRLIFRVNMDFDNVNANAEASGKVVTVYTGLLPYIDSDDELAYILGHEIGHILDDYDGILKWLVVIPLNQKEYEYKADLVGIDLMVKAGYNPVAAISVANKALDESCWDSYFFWSHPRGSKRTLAMYKYIYKKYPWALNTDMIHNVNYQNFVNYSQKDIEEFKQQEKIRGRNQGMDL